MESRVVPAGAVIGFFGHAVADMVEKVREFENEVLQLIPLHGGQVLFRGIRSDGEDAGLPVEFHVIWFPSEEALAAYVADSRRVELIARHGDVFTSKVSVRLDSTVIPEVQI